MKDKEKIIGCKEYPFYYEGMSYDDWYDEREYLANFIHEHRGFKPALYKPLWKQREEGLI